MGRTAEAVPSAASRRSQATDIRRQTSTIQDTGVRALAGPPDACHSCPDRSGTPQPATEAARSEEPSGSPAEAASPSRMRSENRSDPDQSRQRRRITRPDDRPTLQSSPKCEPRHRPDAHLPGSWPCGFPPTGRLPSDTRSTPDPKTLCFANTVRLTGRHAVCVRSSYSGLGVSVSIRKYQETAIFCA